MKRFFLLLLVAFLMVQAAAARSDDITLMGNISPLFYLEKAFSEKVTTSDQTELTVDISDIAVNEDHVYVRFFITDVPQSMKSCITDDTRLYGSYLPTAEILTSENKILTPSSASRYSFLEYNSRLIIGGLMVFDTDQEPQAFYLNFNQIPFDTKPLQEGFSKAVILSPAKNGIYSGTEQAIATSNGLTFSLTSTAQTNEFTMIQPSVQMERKDETFSKFGWVTFQDAADGKRFAVTRGNLFGFNLTDDSSYSPGHAYVFSSVTEETPVLITMDQAYVRRTFENPYSVKIDFSQDSNQILCHDDGCKLILKDVVISKTDEQIRLYFSSEDLTVSDISFTFPMNTGPAEPRVFCGVDTKSDRFACDLYFHEIDFPGEVLDLEIKAIEYLKKGPWTIKWTPVPMEIVPDTRNSDTFSFPSVFGRRPQEDRQQSESVRKVLAAIESQSKELCAREGWIHERFLLDYQFRSGHTQELIPVDQAEQYFTRYISETWYHIDREGHITEQLAVIRDPETHAIISARQLTDKRLLDLVHALVVTTDNAPDPQYRCFEDFIGITESAALFTGESACVLNGTDAICLEFYQALNGVSGSTGSQNITFYINPGDLYINQEKIDYDLGALSMTKTTQVIEKTGSLPDDILLLIGSIK